MTRANLMDLLAMREDWLLQMKTRNVQLAIIVLWVHHVSIQVVKMMRMSSLVHVKKAITVTELLHTNKCAR